ncbi:MAG: hypothetical protein AABY07_08155 [Nanoarchaeota archaeon]
MFNKRGEIDNKFLLIVVLVVAVIFLSNKGMFTGRYTRSLNIIESPQAEETEFIPTYSNPLQVRASQGGYGCSNCQCISLIPSSF